jgi:hypothetical protein
MQHPFSVLPGLLHVADSHEERGHDQETECVEGKLDIEFPINSTMGPYKI